MRIPEALVKRMRAHGEAEYPDEACGLLIGAADGDISSVVPTPNILNALHAQDPETYPRTATTGYVVDPAAQFDAMKQAEARGETIRGIYHSHCDTGAYFSDEDKAQALPLGDPAFPGAIYVVLDVRGGETLEAKAFVWDALRREFLQEPIEG